ncbi:MAG TPA: glutamine-hydrolyzing carbamoyl-phosphate synthase small subunit [Bacteroidales bacterium]|nr:glutamine-hydrolyzing carbamoyl-phosphate synthase small subunit [Bacteroidales bacterium]HPT01697.1 glutamine-hydrolyzing carbamoyl-phosphate synthase small subunit [Bacteroidales bacterium]
MSARLMLEDGTVFTGKSFGDERSVAGEVVFNTSMTGYPESLTDPSYAGQILVATYPLIGNYGVPGIRLTNGLPDFFESERIQVTALIVSDYSEQYSHWSAAQSLGNWLKEYKIPGLYGIDTRALTKIIREKGAMLGKIVFGDDDIDFIDPNQQNLVDTVSCREVITYGEGRTRILLIDCGVKYNIIRHFVRRGTTVIRVPWDYDYSGVEYDGLFISNGPGNPRMCEATIRHLSASIKQDTPIFGICLGNQLLALASGAETYKLKYGHRSHNQPVLLCGSNRAFITSQNHGFAIDQNTLSDEWEPFFINLNDGTNEGLRNKKKKIFSVQFHPEASSGPTDTEYLFDEFLGMINNK